LRGRVGSWGDGLAVESDGGLYAEGRQGSGGGEDYTYSVRARKTGADGENSSKIL
jgi:hypothetical protein